ncbi:hypothetical protein DPMN_175321 [Dreissena polymorpha]|uniref:Uncharacterized protein n=1 Tax=Dreissena polymorpha TaxID=45954 RepID=A0A9D4E7N1_DREPO|nr:hypothetical protein DPMN_175321 [Dreissena polymorpha]
MLLLLLLVMMIMMIVVTLNEMIIENDARDDDDNDDDEIDDDCGEDKLQLFNKYLNCVDDDEDMTIKQKDFFFNKQETVGDR